MMLFLKHTELEHSLESGSLCKLAVSGKLNDFNGFLFQPLM